jgi:Tfp pilus assembly protein FimT
MGMLVAVLAVLALIAIVSMAFLWRRRSTVQPPGPGLYR